MTISRIKNMDFVLLEGTGITKARKQQWRKSLIIAKNYSKICEPPEYYFAFVMMEWTSNHFLFNFLRNLSDFCTV